MEFIKMNLFKKSQDVMPVGLCALGLKKITDINANRKNFKTKGSIYPCFFKLGKTTPVAI